MSTNYYRIPTESEMQTRLGQLHTRVSDMPMSPGDIQRGFSHIPVDRDIQDMEYPVEWLTQDLWEEFTQGTRVHLGKRSGGWRFLWNFHHNRYYSNREELIRFVRSGRVVDEYGQEIQADEFLEMAFTWGKAGTNGKAGFDPTMSRDLDGLRVSVAVDFR